MSRLSEVEIASALCRRHREGILELDQRDQALGALRSDCEDLYLVELTPRVAWRSTHLLARHPLRAGDAVQLASCLEISDELRGIEVSFLAFDHRLLVIAEEAGLSVIARS